MPAARSSRRASRREASMSFPKPAIVTSSASEVAKGVPGITSAPTVFTTAMRDSAREPSQRSTASVSARRTRGSLNGLRSWSSWLCTQYVALNHERKPFNDPRVRRALTLAVDRWEGSRALSRIAVVKTVGALVMPGAPFATSEAELVTIAGFGKDIEASRREARRLLREAGIPEGFSFTYKNRNIPMPFEAVGIFLVDQWRKIGLNVQDRKSTRLNSSHLGISYAVF